MPQDSQTARSKRLVLKNALTSLAGQVVGTPISIVVSAITARYVGASDFGFNYTAAMMTTFAFLFVDWGQGGLLPAEVARDRSAAGRLLGSSIAWRLIAGVVVYAFLVVLAGALNYSAYFQLILGLVVLQCVIQSVSNACQDAIRGFERTDVSAMSQAGTQILIALLVIPTLLLGGRLPAVLVAHAVAYVVVFGGVWRVLRHVGVGPLTFDKATLRALLSGGGAFLLLNFAMTMQPAIDAIMLSKLSTPEVVGWHSVARRLNGALALPAVLVIGALYPTLARLDKEDPVAFAETTRGALRVTILLAVPIALCCAVYREVGVMIFSREAFGPAQQNLVVLAVLLFLVYLSMPLGVAILARGGQRVWAAAQFGCVVVSVALDPFLIPWFQRRYGNGGLGVCVANVVSEVLMVGAAIALNRRLVGRSTVWVLLRGAMAGGLMAGVAYALRSITPFVAAPLALLAYALGLLLVGEIKPDEMRASLAAVQGKLRRFVT